MKPARYSVEIIPAVIVGLIVILYSIPLLFVVLLTFATPESYFDGSLTITFANVRNSFTAPFLRSIAVSAGIALIGAGASLIITLIGSYGFYLFYRPGATSMTRLGKILLSVLLFFAVFNGGIVPHYMIVRYVGLIDTYGSLFVPYILNILIVLYALEQVRKIPGSYFEAARLEGAGEYRIFLCIVIPVKIRVFVTLYLVYFVLHWNNWYPGILFINTSSKQPVQIFLRNLLFSDPGFRNLGISEYSLSPPERMAFILISMVPIIVAFIVILTINNIKSKWETPK
jgi:ABC-type glycerol-3-phosphate transport system permease component